MLPLNWKTWLFFPYDQTVWEPQASRQTRKLDLDSPPPTCLWNLQSPEDPLALSQIWSSCNNWPQLSSCCSPHHRGWLQLNAAKAHGTGKRLGIEIRGSCVPHLSALIPHGKSHKGKGQRLGGVSPLFLAFLVVSRCSFRD